MIVKHLKSAPWADRSAKDTSHVTSAAPSRTKSSNGARFDKNRPTTLSRRSLLGALAGSIAAATTLIPVKGHAAFSAYRQIQSDRNGQCANSYLFEDNTHCVLIDVQLTHQQAATVIEDIKATGKNLQSIFITHPHPENVAALKHIGPAFPRAEIISTTSTLDMLEFAASGWPAFHNRFREASNGQIDCGSLEFECLNLEADEFGSPLALFEPVMKALVGGNQIVEGQHPFLNSRKISTWRDNLQAITDHWDYMFVLPGHGQIGTPDLVAENRSYLNLVETLQLEGFTRQSAREMLLSRFPDYRFPEALEASLNSLFP